MRSFLSVSGLLGVVGVPGLFTMRGGLFMSAAGTVVFMQLLGAIGTFKIMALAGNGKRGNGHKKDGE